MASNLEIVKQESKSNLLMSGPIPHEETKIGACSWPIEHGEREGQACNAKTFDAELCTVHQVLASRRKGKGEVKDVNVQVKSSNPSVPIMTCSSGIPFQPPPIRQDTSIDEILVIMRNFSIAMVNLTEILKKH